MEGVPRIALNALTGVLLRCAAALLHLGTVLLLARILGASGYGTYVFALAVSEILAALAARGLDLWAVRATAAALADSAWGRLRGAVQDAPRAALRSALGASVLVLPFLYLRGAGFAFAMILVPALVLLRVRQATLRGLGRIAHGQWPEMIVRPGLLLLGAFAIGSPLTPVGAMGLQAAVTIFALAAAGALVGMHLPAAARDAALKPSTDDLVHSTGPFFVVAFTQVVFVQADVALLGLLAPPAETGFYAAAAQCALVIPLALNAMNAALAPSLAAFHQAGDATNLRRAAAFSTRVSFAFAIAAGGALWIAAAPVLSLLGPGFSAASGPLRILLLGQLANAAAGPVAYLLLMTGHEKDAARGLAIGAAIHIVLLAALVPSYGATGAAVATAASVLGWNSILAGSVRRRLGLCPALLFA